MKVGCSRPRSLPSRIHLPTEHLIVGRVVGIELSSLLYPVSIELGDRGQNVFLILFGEV